MLSHGLAIAYLVHEPRSTLRHLQKEDVVVRHPKGSIRPEMMDGLLGQISNENEKK